MPGRAQLGSSIWTQLTPFIKSARHRQASQLSRESVLCASRLATEDKRKDRSGNTAVSTPLGTYLSLFLYGIVLLVPNLLGTHLSFSHGTILLMQYVPPAGLSMHAGDPVQGGRQPRVLGA